MCCVSHVMCFSSLHALGIFSSLSFDGLIILCIGSNWVETSTLYIPRFWHLSQIWEVFSHFLKHAYAFQGLFPFFFFCNPYNANRWPASCYCSIVFASLVAPNCNFPNQFSFGDLYFDYSNFIHPSVFREKALNCFLGSVLPKTLTHKSSFISS